MTHERSAASLLRSFSHNHPRRLELFSIPFPFNMTDTYESKRPPRKILGMNSQLSSSIPSSLHTCESLENIFIEESTTPTPMDRMRFANIMSQEIPSIWPYGTILSPVIPPPNIALPYAIAPNMPYTAVPLYQAIGNVASGSNANQQQTSQNSSSREPNKMLIQIGLQCVNQNNPVNINSMNDMATSIGKLNLHVDQAQPGKREDSSSVRSSPLSSSSKEKEAWDIISSSCSSLGAGDSSRVVLNQAKFEELKRLALTGSEIAEKLAYTHRNRPCFKKIDSLCARMKQDLIRPDGVLPNINSQGIAWAVKDFIFVFTRVINAWIIIKGYVYNTPEGLNKVRSALSPDFVRSFAEWQDATVDFVENLMKSFVNLDNLVQAQKNVYQKIVTTTPVKCGSDESNDFLNSSIDGGMSKEITINKNYLYTMVEDSDVTQLQNALNGTYYKTGTYNNIKREALDDSGSTSLEQFLDETFPKALSNMYPGCDLSSSSMALGETKLNCDIRVLENKLSKFSSAYDPNLPKPLGKDLVDKLNVFMQRLMEVKSADLFFKIQFCRNYFPDFIAKTPDFVDLRSIIMKCQTGGYGHIFEVVHDIKLIIYQAKKYLKKHPHPELEKSVISFEADVERILAEEPFENYQFDHIKGKPNEVLYNSGK